MNENHRSRSALSRLALHGNIKIKINVNIKAVHFEDVKIIFGYSNPFKFLIRESIEISLNIGEVCNDNAPFQVSKVWVKSFIRNAFVELISSFVFS